MTAHSKVILDVSLPCTVHFVLNLYNLQHTRMIKYA